MTLPYEEQHAINETRKFLNDLLDPKKARRVPKPVRSYALHLLRHFPGEWTVEYYFENQRMIDTNMGASKLDLNIRYGKK